ncbi:MAG: DUF4160 domain-containing protein [Desulfobacteraceae bacterium]|jgi:hypothetical protein
MTSLGIQEVSLTAKAVEKFRKISIFYGLVIRMYYAPGEYPPHQPHFHVYYNSHRAIVDIRTCELTEGELPRKQAKLVMFWAELHQDELMANWNLVMNGEEPFKIQPLR